MSGSVLWSGWSEAPDHNHRVECVDGSHVRFCRCLLLLESGTHSVSNNPICHYASQPARLNNNWLPQCRLFRGEEAKTIDGRTLGELLCSKADQVQSQCLSCVLLGSSGIPATFVFLYCDCVKRAPLLLLRNQVALSFKVCQPVSLWGIGVIWPDLHFFQYKKA